MQSWYTKKIEHDEYKRQLRQLLETEEKMNVHNDLKILVLYNIFYSNDKIAFVNNFNEIFHKVYFKDKEPELTNFKNDSLSRQISLKETEDDEEVVMCKKHKRVRRRPRFLDEDEDEDKLQEVIGNVSDDENYQRKFTKKKRRKLLITSDEDEETGSRLPNSKIFCDNNNSGINTKQKNHSSLLDLLNSDVKPPAVSKKLDSSGTIKWTRSSTNQGRLILTPVKAKQRPPSPSQIDQLTGLNNSDSSLLKQCLSSNTPTLVEDINISSIIENDFDPIMDINHSSDMNYYSNSSMLNSQTNDNHFSSLGQVNLSSYALPTQSVHSFYVHDYDSRAVRSFQKYDPIFGQNPTSIVNKSCTDNKGINKKSEVKDTSELIPIRTMSPEHINQLKSCYEHAYLPDNTRLGLILSQFASRFGLNYVDKKAANLCDIALKV